MEPNPENRGRRSRRTPLFLLAVLLVSIAFFFLDERFKPDYASITALLAIPASIGGLLAYATNIGHRSGGMGCFVWPTLALLVLVAIAVVVLKEGAICIAMVLPLWIPAAIVGYAVSWWNTQHQIALSEADNDRGARLRSVGWLLLPMVVFSAEKMTPLHWQTRTVSRDIIVAATPEQIWPLLVSIPKISPTEGRWNFTQDILGVPRPERAALVSRNGQWARKAEWGGAIRFEEQIDQLVPNRSIAWTFHFPDESIERTVDRHVSPDGAILRIETGRYALTRLSGSRTRIQLSTQYRMRTRIPQYLELWGEKMLGDIQNNVLTIVKHRAESGTQ